MKGKTPLSKKIKLQQTFDGKGNLLTKVEEGYHHQFTYDLAGKLLKQELKGEKYGHSVQVHEYDQKGLIIKAVVTQTDPQGNKTTSETSYTYSYN